MEKEETSRRINNQTKSRKFVRLVFLVALVFLLSAISVIVVEHYIFPRLATTKWLNKYKFLKKVTDGVVVVNKTEQVTVSEDSSIARNSNKSAASVVEILSEAQQNRNVSRAQDSSRQQKKIGSGLIVTADGLILTYSEGILPSPATYKIFTSNNNSYDARLLAVDSFSNLAILKIDDVSDLPTTTFIASEDMKSGAKVVAIGRNGSNVDIIYKSGLLSQFNGDFSLAGPLASSEKLQGVYLTDFDMSEIGDENLNGATIADYNGDVVGILGSIKAANQNQFFIISVNYVENLIDQYISTGTIKRGSLGVYYQNLTKETVNLLGINENEGAIVYSPSNQQGLAVISGGAADKAGIKISDIVKSVNGEEANENQNIAYLISKYKPGDEVELGISRGGQNMTVKADLQ